MVLHIQYNITSLQSANSSCLLNKCRNKSWFVRLYRKFLFIHNITINSCTFSFTAVMSPSSHMVAPSICHIHFCWRSLFDSSISTSFQLCYYSRLCVFECFSLISLSPLRHLIHHICEILYTCNVWLRSNGDLEYDKSICWAQIESINSTTAIHHNHTIMKRWDTLALWGGCLAKMAHVKPHLYKWALDLSQSMG